MSLFIAANRLPINVTKKDGLFELHESAGGVATGLRTWAEKQDDKNIVWVGWPGFVPKSKSEEFRLREELLKLRVHPVFLTKREVESYYGGFCNKTIWPLFHYFTMHATFEPQHWQCYCKVNQDYADALIPLLKPGDSVMVNDYHLMLLPKLIKEKMPEVNVFFFLHIPFPTFEIYRLLPSVWRSEILQGILASDVAGFHTPEYTEYFLACTQRFLHYDVRSDGNLHSVTTPARDVKVGTFPLGIDFNKFDSMSRQPEVQQLTEEIRKTTKCIGIISVDRLDYTKGIGHRLRGYEMFLEQNPEWLGKTTLVMIVTPSREAVDHYQQMKRQIDETVGAINGRFATLDWTPIIYQYKTLTLDTLIPYYSACEVALVTPLRDGMNLVAKEYIASHSDNKGVLILSEMAGTAKQMREAVLINPFSIEEIAAAIKKAVEMPEAEQMRRNHIMRKRLRRADIFRWAEEFFNTL